eukprot:scaffold2430_cov137-Isochrysis_galbana.AAC.1
MVQTVALRARGLRVGRLYPPPRGRLELTLGGALLPLSDVWGRTWRCSGCAARGDAVVVVMLVGGVARPIGCRLIYSYTRAWPYGASAC